MAQSQRPHGHGVSFVNFVRITDRGSGAVVKLVYTLRSGRSGGNSVKVQVLSAPPIIVSRGGENSR